MFKYCAQFRSINNTVVYPKCQDQPNLVNLHYCMLESSEDFLPHNYNMEGPKKSKNKLNQVDLKLENLPSSLTLKPPHPPSPTYGGLRIFM